MLDISPEALPGVLLMVVVYVFVGLVISSMRLPGTIKLMVWLGLVLRVVGIVGRIAIAADAHVYFRTGVLYSDYMTRLDPVLLFDRTLWLRPQQSIYGTNFIGFISGLVVSVLGESWFGAFLAFAMMAFLGLMAYARGFRLAFPQANLTRYWGWLLLFPSLWFWPSSIGKEAVLMLGFGVATLGFVGNGRRMNPILLGLGAVIVLLVRPEVAAVLLFAVMISHWVDFDRWNAKRFVQAVLMLGIGLTAIWFAMSSTRAGGLDPDRVEAFVEYNAAQARQGGSAIETPAVGLGSVPIALVNVLFRPFLWEASSTAALFSAGEILMMWMLILIRRRQLRYVLKVWRRHRVLRFAVPFVLLYTIALGMNLANLGIIARQRVLVFPLLFLILEAGTMLEPRRRRRYHGYRGRGYPPARPAPHASS